MQIPTQLKPARLSEVNEALRYRVVAMREQGQSEHAPRLSFDVIDPPEWLSATAGMLTTRVWVEHAKARLHEEGFKVSHLRRALVRSK